MSRIYVIVSLIGVVALAACGPAAPAPAVLPTFLSPQNPGLATAEINEAYPTEQAKQASSSLTVSGFSMSLQRAWRDGKQVYADLCYTLPDASDWTVWAAHLEYGGQANSEFSSSLVSRQAAEGSQTGQRCDQIGFYVAPDADLSAAALTIESLGVYPSQDEYCALYMPKIQQALNERGKQITLNCAETDGNMAMQITSKPEAMSKEEAEQLVFSDEFYTVMGPWTFPLTFSQ
jgi:hypothetical protein